MKKDETDSALAEDVSTDVIGTDEAGEVGANELERCQGKGCQLAS